MKLLLETNREIIELNADVKLNLDMEVIIQAKVTGEEVSEHELLLGFDELVGVPAFQIMIEEMGRQLPKTGDVMIFNTSNKLVLNMVVNSITYSKDKMVVLCDIDMQKTYCACENPMQDMIINTPNAKIVKCMNNGKWGGEACIQSREVDNWMINNPIKFNYCPICGRYLG